MRTARDVLPDELPPGRYIWGHNGRIVSNAHLIDPDTFQDTYETICGVSGYVCAGFKVPTRMCPKCRAAIIRQHQEKGVVSEPVPYLLRTARVNGRVVPQGQRRPVDAINDPRRRADARFGTRDGRRDSQVGSVASVR
jgi:hypothetical protein